MKKIFLLFSIIAFVIIGGCKDSQREKMMENFPESPVELEKMNTVIDLVITPGNYQGKLDQPVQVLLHLVSDDQVRTKPNGNILTYLYDQENAVWNRINDLSSYGIPASGMQFIPSNQDITLQPGYNGEDGFFTVVHPLITDYSVPQQFLIISTANLVVDGQVTDEIVGAYEIFTLTP